MAHTPPPVKVTFGPQPMSRIRLRAAYAEARANKAAVRPLRINVLRFGRAIDASLRDETDYFIADYPPADNPVLSVARALRELISPFRDEFPHLVRTFESDNPVDISVGLDNFRDVFSKADPSNQQDVLRAVGLGVELLAHLREDPGLAEQATCQILTYAALEAYYYHRATAVAKTRFDAFRDLIRLASGRVQDYVNQEDDLGIGLKVWEGWQAVRSLGTIFDLSVLAAELREKRAPHLPGLFYCADVILGFNQLPVDTRSVRESLDQLVGLARERGRPEDLRFAKPFATLLRQLEDEASAQPEEEPPTDIFVDDTPVDPLPFGMRATFDATTEEEKDDRAIYRSRGREASAIVDDLKSVLERYNILLNGDDNSLIFEVAPVLQRNWRLLYHELAVEHSDLEAAIYDHEVSTSEENKHIRALRGLVEKANELVQQFRDLVEALASGDLVVGFETDRETNKLPPPEVGLSELPRRLVPSDPLGGILLDASIVVGIRSEADSVVFEVRFALVDWHPRYDGKSGADHCRKLGKLSLTGAKEIRWKRINLQPSAVGGEVGLGRFDSFKVEKAAHHLRGDWGEVELEGASLHVSLE